MKPARSRRSAASSSARLVATGCTSCATSGSPPARLASSMRRGADSAEKNSSASVSSEFLRRRRIAMGRHRLRRGGRHRRRGRGRVAPGRDDRRVRPAEVAHDRVEIRGGERLAMTQDRLGDLDHVAREAARDRRRRARIARDLPRDRDAGRQIDRVDQAQRQLGIVALFLGRVRRLLHVEIGQHAHAASDGYRRRRAARGRRGLQAWEKSPSRNPPARSADTNSRGEPTRTPLAER